MKKERYKVWMKLFEYIYSDSIELQFDIVDEVQALAEKYNLQQLFYICQSTRTSTVIPPSSLNSDLKWSLNNKLFSDLCFEVEGKLFYAHKAIICARSEYFRRFKRMAVSY